MQASYQTVWKHLSAITAAIALIGLWTPGLLAQNQPVGKCRICVSYPPTGPAGRLVSTNAERCDPDPANWRLYTLVDDPWVGPYPAQCFNELSLVLGSDGSFSGTNTYTGSWYAQHLQRALVTDTVTGSVTGNSASLVFSRVETVVSEFGVGRADVQMAYRTSNGSAGTTGNQITIVANGTVTFQERRVTDMFPYVGKPCVTIDSAGSAAFVATITLTLPSDTTPPTTTAVATANGSPYTFDTWTPRNVSVALAATDNSGGSGVKDVRYSINGAPFVIVPGALALIDVTTEGQKTVSFYATDKADNSETAKSVRVKIDRSPPITDASATVSPLPLIIVPYFFGTLTNKDVKVTLTPNDSPLDGSGIGRIIYKATGAQSIPATTVFGSSASFIISAEGDTTIEYLAIDGAGNLELPKTNQVRIDKTSPTLECPERIRVMVGSPICWVFRVRDNVSPKDTGPLLSCNPASVPFANWDFPPGQVAFAPGTFEIRGKAIDTAGNQSKECKITVEVLKPLPIPTGEGLPNGLPHNHPLPPTIPPIYVIPPVR